MKTGNMFRILKLVTLVINTSYFVGILFYIISDVNKAISNDQNST